MNDKSTENQAYKDKSNGSEISRRGFLGSAALATVAGTLAVNGSMAQDGQQANDRSKAIPVLRTGRWTCRIMTPSGPRTRTLTVWFLSARVWPATRELSASTSSGMAPAD